MAARTGRLPIRGPSSPDLGQERPTDRVRPAVILDLGIRDDARPRSEPNARPTRLPLPRR